VLFTTLVQPKNIAEQGVGWGYIGPRNGHITLFSADALYRAWALRGFTCVSFNQSTHAAYRSPPAFARDLLARAGRFRTLPLAAT
jgi:2-polyprenyl-6-hydroxyphenyl methylase/3-demethylubiquinone-9 3-methyltransferase